MKSLKVNWAISPMLSLTTTHINIASGPALLPDHVTNPKVEQ